MNHINRKHAQGFSLLELLLVLGVIAALAIAAFIVFPSVQAGNQANTETANLNTIQAGLKGLYTNGRFTGLNNTSAITARVVPANMVANDFTGATPPTNIWGGAVTVAEASTGDTHFEIVYGDVTQAACVKLVPALVSNFEAVETQVAVVADATNVLGGGVITFDPGQVGANCVAALNEITVYGR
jgi:prepilin-type N-terminal cleavage/methylation domain-containing protein